MWSLVFTGIKELVGKWFETKKAKADAEIAFRERQLQGELDWDNIAQTQAQYSWKDEFITIIWFSPLIVAWFEPERAMKWVEWVSKLPYFYQFAMFGIIAASFGLRWYFKQQNFKVPKG